MPAPETMKTFRRVRRGCKYLEKPIDSCQLQNYRDLRREGGEFQVAVSLHRFFHTAQHHFNAGTVDLNYVGEVEDKARPITLQYGLHFPEDA